LSKTVLNLVLVLRFPAGDHCRKDIAGKTLHLKFLSESPCKSLFNYL